MLEANKLMSALVERLHLPIRYTKDGKIDVQSYMRERIFYAVDMQEVSNKSKGTDGIWDQIKNLQK